MAEKTRQRLLYVDAMRGVACILMFQTHAYDSWLGGAARAGRFFAWSQLASTLAASSFLFLVGVSMAIAVDGMSRRGALPGAIAGSTVRRGAKILAFALLFRTQEYLLGLPNAPWTDLLRVDVLNVIGVSIALIGVVCWAARGRSARAVAGAGVALAVAMVAPLVWTSWRPQRLPWYLESYFNGVHTFGKPQPWLFPIFPWTAFCFAGLAAGSWLRGEWAERRQSLSIALVAAGGVALAALALYLDGLPIQIYSVYDFWHTSPNFFFVRVGILLVILAACYVLSRYATGMWGFTRLIQLGQSSLVVYWVHIEFVYGGFSILPKRAVGVPMATAGLLVIIAAMTALAAGRIWFLAHRTELVSWFREKVRPAGEF